MAHDDPTSHRGARDSVAIEKEPFIPEELDLSCRAASVGKTVENIPEAREPMAGKNILNYKEFKIRVVGYVHHRHGFDQSYVHGPFHHFDSTVSGHVG